MRVVHKPISLPQILLLFWDVGVVIGSTLFSTWLRLGYEVGSAYVRTQLFSFIISGLIYLMAFFFFGLYDIRKDYRSLEQGLRIFAVSALAFVGVVFTFYVEWSLRLGRGIFLINGLSIAFLVMVARLAVSSLMEHTAFQKKALVLGSGSSAEAIADALRNTVGAGLRLIGFVDDNSASRVDGNESLPTIGNVSQLSELIEMHEISALVIATPGQREPKIVGQLLECARKGVELLEMPLLYEQLTGKVPLEHITEEQWLMYSVLYRSRFIGERLKRAMDVLVSSVVLLACAPLAVLTVLLTKVTSDGPVLYRQVRAGKWGKEFQILKFRSMVKDAEKETGAIWSEPGDRRVTKWGRLIRRFHIDEIPQFINVLKGEMSLVGPRPERPELVGEYLADIPFFPERLTVKPGITGWAQVKYRYSSNRQEALEKLAYDLYYIKNRTILLDSAILASTIGKLLKGG